MICFKIYNISLFFNDLGPHFADFTKILMIFVPIFMFDDDFCQIFKNLATLKFWWINYKFQICKLWFKSAKTHFMRMVLLLVIFG